MQLCWEGDERQDAEAGGVCKELDGEGTEAGESGGAVCITTNSLGHTAMQSGPCDQPSGWQLHVGCE